MTAEIVSVGTELLLGQITDTHAPLMARILAECGIGCTRRATIGDNMDRLVGTLKGAIERADVVVTIGGLGPTLDDLTRDGIALALGDEMEEVPEVAEKLRQFFASRNIRMAESTLRQAQKPTSATLVDNPNGTAPGLICQKNGKVVIALPGPKGEFDPMAQGPVRQFLEQLQGGQVIHSRVLRIIGMGESHVEERVRDLMDGENPTVAPYAQTAECHLRVTARAPNREAADRLIDPVVDEIRSRLGNHLYGFNETTIEAATLDLLVAKGETVAVAESMTGGALGARITSVPGSSKAFKGGVIAYTVSAKESVLGVPSEIIAAHGPVSEEVAKAMAEAVRDRLGATMAFRSPVMRDRRPTSMANRSDLPILGLPAPTERPSSTLNIEDCEKTSSDAPPRPLWLSFGGSCSETFLGEHRQTVTMTMQNIRDLLLGCLIGNYALLIIWWLTVILHWDWPYEMSAKWFGISLEKVKAINFAALVFYKMAIILLFLVPFLALSVVLARA